MSTNNDKLDVSELVVELCESKNFVKFGGILSNFVKFGRILTNYVEF